MKVKEIQLLETAKKQYLVKLVSRELEKYKAVLNLTELTCITQAIEEESYSKALALIYYANLAHISGISDEERIKNIVKLAGT